jgi:hypothetical protein
LFYSGIHFLFFAPYDQTKPISVSRVVDTSRPVRPIIRYM